MKIEIEIYSASEFAAFAQFAASMAGAIHIREEENKLRFPGQASVGAVSAVPAAGDPDKLAALVTAAGELKAKVEAEAPKPKATRTKKADAPATAPAADATTTAEEPPAITAEEVKKTILDLLNDWTEAAPDNKDIRIQVLAPLLKTLGSEKIKEIDPARFKEVAGLVDESREALAAFKAQSAPIEEE